MASLSRILHIVWKEIVQIRRDRRMFGLVMMMPLLELLIFGYVVATDIDHISLAVCDYSHTARESRLRGAARAERLLPRPRGLRRRQCDRRPARSRHGAGRARHPARLRRAAQARRPSPGHGGDRRDELQHGDDRGVVSGADDARPGGRRRRPGGGGEALVTAPPLVTAEPRVWFNPELRSVKFMVPGIVCVLLMESLVILTAIAIVKEKERGTIEQILVSPIRATSSSSARRSRSSASDTST